jgi:hypothetical protein
MMSMYKFTNCINLSRCHEDMTEAVTHDTHFVHTSPCTNSTDPKNSIRGRGGHKVIETETSSVSGYQSEKNRIFDKENQKVLILRAALSRFGTSPLGHLECVASVIHVKVMAIGQIISTKFDASEVANDFNIIVETAHWIVLVE